MIIKILVSNELDIFNALDYIYSKYRTIPKDGIDECESYWQSQYSLQDVMTC